MKMNQKNNKLTYKKIALGGLLFAFTTLYACDGNENRNTEADANSVQESMQPDVSQGAGYSTDTSGSGTVGPGLDTTMSTDDAREVIPPDTKRENDD